MGCCCWEGGEPITKGCCCSKAFVICGCCCSNCVVEVPFKLGCALWCSICCISCRLCLAVGDTPLPCCCCGPTCANTKTLCKTQGTVLFCRVTSSLPCDPDAPILCTLLPFCTIYPRCACFPTLESLGFEQKQDEVDADGVTITQGNTGGPPCNETMQR